MNLRPTVMASLRPLLASVREYDQRIDALAEPTKAAQGAVARLQAQIADLDDKAAKSAVKPISPDADRVSALIAGADVAQKERKEIEAAAASVRLIDAQRQQAVIDLDAVQTVLTKYTDGLLDLQKQKSHAEAIYLEALADALFEAYQRAISQFVSEHLPPILSACQTFRRITGKSLSHESNLHTGL
jgi:chromosome segregation ATPase